LVCSFGGTEWSPDILCLYETKSEPPSPNGEIGGTAFDPSWLVDRNSVMSKILQERFERGLMRVL